MAADHVPRVRAEHPVHDRELCLPRLVRPRDRDLAAHLPDTPPATVRRLYDLQPPARKIVDYLGTHQHLAVDIDLSVDKRGGLRLRSGEQRFYERYLSFRFPMFFSGVADVCEWYDDAIGQYRIEVSVQNRRWGPLFGYNGHFDVEWLSLPPGKVPPHARPRREERRE